MRGWGGVGQIFTKMKCFSSFVRTKSKRQKSLLGDTSPQLFRRHSRDAESSECGQRCLVSCLRSSPSTARGCCQPHKHPGGTSLSLKEFSHACATLLLTNEPVLVLKSWDHKSGHLQKAGGGNIWNTSEGLSSVNEQEVKREEDKRGGLSVRVGVELPPQRPRRPRSLQWLKGRL